MTYWATAALLPLMALTGVNTRHGLFSLVDKLARAAAILVSLYWITTYLPGIKKDYQAKNGNVRGLCVGFHLPPVASQVLIASSCGPRRGPS